MSDPTSVVRAYFAAVTAGEAKTVRSLFAPDAELLSAAGALKGAEAIGGLYERVLAAGASKPVPGPLVVDGDRVAVEIDLEVNGRSARLGDFFTIRDDMIQRLVIYSLTQSDIQVLSTSAEAGSSQ